MAAGAEHVMELPPGFVLEQPNIPALPEGFVLEAQATQPQGYRAKLLPLSRDASGNISFDSNAGIVGSIKSGLTLARDVSTGAAKLPSAYGVPGSVPFGDPQSAGERVADMAMLGTPVSPVTRAGGGWAGVPISPTPGQLVTNAAARIGVDIPKAAASDSMLMQRGGQALSNIPFGGSSLRKAGERSTTQLNEAAETVAAMPTGTKTLPEQAGATARAGIEQYVGPITEARASKLYDAVDSAIDPNVRVPITNTSAVAEEIISRRANAGIAGDGGAVQQILEASTRPEGLNFQGIKDLRTSVGEKLKTGLLPGDISQSELKQIYGALSKDLASAVEASGSTTAKAAFDRANKYYQLVSQRRENLDRLLNAKSDEALFSRIVQLAGSTGAADVKLLAQARKAVSTEEWADIASAAVGRLGRNSAGEFSPVLFVRDYGRMSEAGKSLLFNSVDKNLRRHLDDIATVSERSKAWQRFSNPSGTAQNVIGGTQVIGGLTAGKAALAGSMVEPLTAIGTVIGTTILSRALARSATAAPIAQWSRAYEMAALRPGASTIASLSIASRNLANTLSDKLGANASPMDFLRSILGPGPVPVRAKGEQAEP